MTVAAVRALATRRRPDRPRYVVDVRTVPIDSGRWTDGIERAFFSASMWLAGRALDGATAITEPIAAIVSRASGFPMERIGTWSSGVDTSAFDPSACTPTRGEAGTFTVIYHGSLLRTRGLESAVRAMRLVRDRHPEVRLVMVGSGPDAVYLEALADESGLGDVVRFVPPVRQSEVPQLIFDADAGLIPFPDLPCWRVSSPLKLLEYMAMEKPVIATRVACNTAVAGDAPYMVWAESDRPDDLADAICAAADDSQRLARDGALGRSEVLRAYTWRAQADRLQGFLESLSRRTEDGA